MIISFTDYHCVPKFFLDNLSFVRNTPECARKSALGQCVQTTVLWLYAYGLRWESLTVRDNFYIFCDEKIRLLLHIECSYVLFIVNAICFHAVINI